MAKSKDLFVHTNELTGRTRPRINFLRQVILQVEYWVEELDSNKNLKNRVINRTTAWRDATTEDVTVGLLDKHIAFFPPQSTNKEDK